jgi:hypothetical protein
VIQAIPQPTVEIFTLEKVDIREANGDPDLFNKSAITQTVNSRFNIVIAPRARAILNNMPNLHVIKKWLTVLKFTV